MATDAFISYCRENAVDAERVCGFLEQNNISCWIAPRNIPGGMEWPEAIVEGIKGSRIMLVLLSEHTQRSKQIGRELTLASDNDLTVVTVRLDNVPAPDRLQYFTSNLQWIDAFGECFGSGMAKLLATLRFQLGKPQAPVTSKIPVPPNAVQNKKPSYAKKIGIGVCLGFLALGTMGYFIDQDKKPAPALNTPSPAPAIDAATTPDLKRTAPTEQKSVQQFDSASDMPAEPQGDSSPRHAVSNAAAFAQSAAGTWAGTYVCGGFANQAQLSLVAEGNGAMQGMLQFNALPRPGSYYVRGSVNPADSSVFLKYVGWQYRPPGNWVPLNIDAQIDVANGVMQGRLTSGLCTAFEMRKLQ